MLKHNQSLLSAIGVRYLGLHPGGVDRMGFFQGGMVAQRHAQTFTPSAKSNAIPTGGNPARAFAMALTGGEIAARVSVQASTTALISAIGQLSATLTAVATTILNANQGRQISGSSAGSTSTSASLAAFGVLFSELKIGASPSAIDIADQVWSRTMSPFTTVGTFGYKLSNLTGGGGGGGGGPTAAEVADAVWAYVTRTLTASPGPTSAAIASQVRTELAVELGRLDATISSRLAAAGYTAPANSDITAIKAKTDNLPASPASEGSVTARPTLAQIEASTVLAKEATVAARPTNPLLTSDSRLNNLDATISSRLATAGYTAPTTPPTVAQIRTEIDTNSTKLDVAVSTRLASASYTTPPTAAAVRAEIDANSTKLDVAVGTRAAQTTADDIKKNTDLIPAGL